MLCVNGQYEDFYYSIFTTYSVGIDFSRQNMMSTDVRFRRQKSTLTARGPTLDVRIGRLL